MYSSSVGGRLRVAVKHRPPAPNRHTWEIHRECEALPAEEAPNQFGSWEEVSQVGKKMLKKSSAI
jgi:hypothetical protein